MTAEASTDALSAADCEFFHREGYLVLEEFLEPDYNKLLMADVDELMRHRAAKDQRLLVSYPQMGLLTSHPPLMAKLESIMGTGFAMHHIHAVRQDAGNRGVNWHQDYEQTPQTNRAHIMVHVFYYMNGLNGEIGDLLFVPRSQGIVIQNGGLGIFGTEDLPGTVCVDSLPPGSAIIVHSALWHARRAKPGGEGRPRYFIDVSYCQKGVLWPGYPRHLPINQMALEKGLDRDGRYAHVYDSSQFFDRHEMSEKLKERNQGSLVLQLKDL